MNDECTVMENPGKDEIRLMRHTWTPLRFESSVLVVSSIAGLHFIESKSLTRRRKKVIVARGVANTQPLLHVYILVTSLSTKPVHVPKHMVIARGTKFPTLREQPNGLSGPKNNVNEVNAAYKPSERKQSQMRNHEDVTKNDEEGLEQD